MTQILTQGYHEARSAGDLDGTPDIRIGLGLSGFALDPDDVNVADATLDEYDGSGYTRYDAASPVGGYSASLDMWRIDCADGSFGATVAAATEEVEWLFVILHVDGTAANDIILGATDSVAGINGTGGALTIAIPTDGLLFDRTAA